MKKLMLILTMCSSLFLLSCATTQTFKQSDVTEEGVRFSHGAKDGISVGDTIIASRAKLMGAGKGQYMHSKTLGSLTVIKVEQDYSIAKKNGEFDISNGDSLSKY